jgi:hypothetical protein
MAVASAFRRDDQPPRARSLSMNINDICELDEAMPNVIDLRHMSADQLARLGIKQIAYVKPIVVKGSTRFAIHAADGTRMAIAESLDVAIEAIVQHEMEPVQLH